MRVGIFVPRVRLRVIASAAFATPPKARATDQMTHDAPEKHLEPSLAQSLFINTAEDRTHMIANSAYAMRNTAVTAPTGLMSVGSTPKSITPKQGPPPSHHVPTTPALRGSQPKNRTQPTHAMRSSTTPNPTIAVVNRTRCRREDDSAR